MIIENFEYINEKEEVVEVEKVEIDYFYNQNKYQQALAFFNDNKDTLNFASKILPEMILSPTNLKDVNTFKNDFEALNGLIVVLMDVQTKKRQSQLKKKPLVLKMD